MWLSFVLVLVTGLFNRICIGQSEWNQVPVIGTTPDGRQRAVMASWTNGGSSYLVLFGGRSNNGGALNDVWTLDLSGDEEKTWTELVVASSSGGVPSPRESLAGGVYGDKLVVMGGQQSDRTVLNDLWEFDLNTREWTELNSGSGNGPATRYGHAGGVAIMDDGPYMIVSHGFDLGLRWQDSWAFPLSQGAGGRWIEITPSSGPIPFARCLVGSATYSDGTDTAFLGMFGGCGSGGYGPCPDDEMWVLTFGDLTSGARSDSEWEEPAGKCLSARNYATMAAGAPEGLVKFFVYGGGGGGLVQNDPAGKMNEIDLDTLSYKQYLPDNSSIIPETGADQSTLVFLDGIIYLQAARTSNIYRLTYSSQFLNTFQCAVNKLAKFRQAHGALMGISWGFLIPVSVFIARFGRKLLAKKAAWFQIHRSFNLAAAVFTVIGFVFAFLFTTTGHFMATPHSQIGVTILAIVVIQTLNGLFRPHTNEGDEEKSKKRTIWEYVHKYLGRLGLLLGLINPFWGLIYVRGLWSPSFIVYFVWVMIYVIVWIILSILGYPKNDGLTQATRAKIIGAFKKD